MAWFTYYLHLFITFLIFILLVFIEGVTPRTFRVINNCNYTVWPAILDGFGSREPNTTGFELAKGSSRSFQVSIEWAGVFWGRTNCNFADPVNGSCATGDCGTGQVECNGGGYNFSPATIVQFTLHQSKQQEIYDVSLLDGYNLPVIVEGSGEFGECATASCVADLNKNCPSELRIDGGAACNSACAAFKQPQYCCTGEYNSQHTCKATNYSEYFKSACPNAYAYPYYDDSMYRFTCNRADYNITFCPNVGSPYFYRNCRYSKFECGNITAQYPFYGGIKGEECGRPGLQLHCDDDTPKFDFRNASYQVLDIDRDRQVLSIAREDLINNGFCSPKLQNSTLPLDSELFNVAPGPAYTNLTLFYDCQYPSLISSDSVVFPCNVAEKTGSSYENVSVVIGDVQALQCVANVTVPILQTSLERLLNSSLGLEEALEAGFKVEWKEDRETCRQCENSGGMCGFDEPGNQTVCYCPYTFDNWQEAKKCPYKPPSQLAPYAPMPSPATSRTHVQGSTFKINTKWKITIGVVGSVVVISAILLYFLILIWKKKLGERQNVKAFIEKYGRLALKRYSFAEVKKMTKAFKHTLGQGGYGSVYKGKLPNGDLIAVKVLKESKGNGEEFINEVASISRTSHVNIVTLLGFCYEGSKRALIYEYMPNGSLDKFIYEKKRLNTESILEWRTLYQITLGIARGLEYLHQGCNTRILHFDIKPHNILLDEEFCPRISDFGLAKLCQRKESVVSMLGARGTTGYMAPELSNRSFGGVSYKSDVYSFGMMVLEMVGGRKNLDVEVAASHASQIYFPQWIYKQLELGQDLKLNGIVTEDDETIARKMILVSLWCIQISPSDRPSMTKVVEMLEGSLESLQVPPQPFLSSPDREEQINTAPSSTSEQIKD